MGEMENEGVARKRAKRSGYLRDARWSEFDDKIRYGCVGKPSSRMRQRSRTERTKNKTARRIER